MSKGKVEIQGGSIVASLDTNEDGQPVMTAKIHLGEGAEEILAKLKKGEATSVEVDAKSVKFDFDPLGGMTLIIDTDKDGDPSAEVNLSLVEAVDEAGQIFKK
jgi:hypothetical protein